MNRGILLSVLIVVSGCAMARGTHLMRATLKGDVRTVETLLKDGAPVNYRYHKARNRTPLMAAAEFGYLDIVHLLVENGADVNAQDTRGMTPLIAATLQADNIEIARYLVEKRARIEISDFDGYTAAKYASCKGRSDILKFLVDEKKADINIRGKGGWSLLHDPAIYTIIPQ